MAEEIVVKEKPKKLRMSLLSLMICLLSFLVYVYFPLQNEIMDHGSLSDISLPYFLQLLILALALDILVFISDQFDADGSLKKENFWLYRLLNFLIKLGFISASLSVILLMLIAADDSGEKPISAIYNILPVLLELAVYIRLIGTIESIAGACMKAIRPVQGTIGVIPYLSFLIAAVISNGFAAVGFVQFCKGLLIPAEDISGYLDWTVYFIFTLTELISQHISISDLTDRFTLYLPEDLPVYCLDIISGNMRNVLKHSLLCIASGLCVYAFTGLLYKILEKGAIIMKKLLRTLLTLDALLKAKDVPGARVMLCPFCGTRQAILRVTNTVEFPIDDNITLKIKEETSPLAKFLAVKKEPLRFIEFDKDSDSFRTKNGSVVKKDDKFQGINNLSKLTNDTIENSAIKDGAAFEYLGIPENVEVMNGSIPEMNIFFYICSSCGMENLKTSCRPIYFLGEHNSGKTTILHYISHLHNICNSRYSFDNSYWKNILELNKDKIEATDVLYSPPLYVNIKGKMTCFFDVMGEHTEDIATHITNGTVYLTISIDVDKENSLLVDKLVKDINNLNEVAKIINSGSHGRVKYVILFSKADNLHVNGNMAIFKDAIKAPLNLLENTTGCHKYLLADPNPKRYSQPQHMNRFMRFLTR